jgi:hypothetical protein
MTRSSDGIELTLFSKPQLLITESAEDFAALNAALMEEIRPRGIIERLYVADVAALVWEILRLRRCKVAIINTAFKNALSEIVYRLANEPEMDTLAIEAEAIRSVFSELEVLDKMLTLLESRRNKALRSIADYRNEFAKQVREASNRVIEADPVIQLENQAA